MSAHESQSHQDYEFTVTVVATSAKPVPAKPNERIATLKRAAMREFAIPQDKADQYRLAPTPGDPSTEFDDNKTVADYGLHTGSKIYLVKAHNDA